LTKLRLRQIWLRWTLKNITIRTVVQGTVDAPLFGLEAVAYCCKRSKVEIEPFFVTITFY
jgi:hypothetical protein